MFSEGFKHVCMFKIPLPVMENAQTSTQNTSKGCFSLNHVCMFEKSPKPLCLSCFLQFQLNATQPTPSIFQFIKKIQCDLPYRKAFQEASERVCMFENPLPVMENEHTYIHT